MDRFHTFLNSLERENNSATLESISQGYSILFEAQVINNAFLLKLVNGNKDILISVKNKVNEMWQNQGMNEVIRNPQKPLAILYMMELKDPGTVNEDTLTIFHDMAIANKMNTLNEIDSDATPSSFSHFLTKTRRNLINVGNMTPEEEKIWLRIKVMHDFGDGFQWVVALDENGEVTGFIPSCITRKAAKHCGNDQHGRKKGDQYYELRKNNKPYLTVILNKDDKIAESKSRGNQKNANIKEVLPYLKWLLKHEKVKGVGRRYDYGYSPDMNMGLKDFFGYDDEFIEKMEKDKPSLLGETEKKILYYKRALKSGELTEEDIIKICLHSSPNNEHYEGYDSSEFESLTMRELSYKGKPYKMIKLWELRGILGKIPVTMDQIINLAGYDKRFDATELANTSPKLLTYMVQKKLYEAESTSDGMEWNEGRSPTLERLIYLHRQQTPNVKLYEDLALEYFPYQLVELDYVKEENLVDMYKKYPEKLDDLPSWFFQNPWEDPERLRRTFIKAFPEKRYLFYNMEHLV